jgi:hypothetical protein
MNDEPGPESLRARGEAGRLGLSRARLATWARFEGRLLPVLLALALAALAWPVVALTLRVFVHHESYLNEAGREYVVSYLAAGDPARWAVAAAAVFASALVAGAFGAPLVRRHALLGGWFTVTLAWLVAAMVAPAVPLLIGRELGFEFGCIDTCSEWFGTGSRDPWGLELMFFWLGPLAEPPSFAALVVGVAIWGGLLRSQSRAPRPPLKGPRPLEWRASAGPSSERDPNSAVEGRVDVR